MLLVLAPQTLLRIVERVGLGSELLFPAEAAAA